MLTTYFKFNLCSTTYFKLNSYLQRPDDCSQAINLQIFMLLGRKNMPCRHARFKIKCNFLLVGLLAWENLHFGIQS